MTIDKDIAAARARCEQINGGPVQIRVRTRDSGEVVYVAHRDDVMCSGATPAQAAERFIRAHSILFDEAIAILREHEPPADAPDAIEVETTDGLHVARYRARLAPGPWKTITGRIS